MGITSKNKRSLRCRYVIVILIHLFNVATLLILRASWIKNKIRTFQIWQFKTFRNFFVTFFTLETVVICIEGIGEVILADFFTHPNLTWYFINLI